MSNFSAMDQDPPTSVLPEVLPDFKPPVLPVNPRPIQMPPLTMRPKRAETDFSCELCQKTYINRRRLLRHLCTHFSTKLFVCIHCKLSFSNGDSLRIHQRNLHKLNRLSTMECVYCQEPFLTESELTHHAIRVHADQSLERPILSLTKQGAYVQSKEDNPFLCRFCPLAFTRDQNRDRHMIQCGFRTALLKCSVCGFAVGSEHVMHKHLKEAHPDEQPKLCCAICLSIFPSGTKLIRHAFDLHKDLLGEHKEVKRYRSRKSVPNVPLRCRFCSKINADRRDLMRHEVTHLKGRLYMCLMCPSSYLQCHPLRQHVQLAHAEAFQAKLCQGYRCGMCFIRFQVETNLLEHALTTHANNPALLRDFLPIRGEKVEPMDPEEDGSGPGNSSTPPLVDIPVKCEIKEEPEEINEGSETVVAGPLPPPLPPPPSLVTEPQFMVKIEPEVKVKTEPEEAQEEMVIKTEPEWFSYDYSED